MQVVARAILREIVAIDSEAEILGDGLVPFVTVIDDLARRISARGRYRGVLDGRQRQLVAATRIVHDQGGGEDAVAADGVCQSLRDWMGGQEQDRGGGGPSQKTRHDVSPK